MTEKTIVLPPNPAGNGTDANYRLTVMAPKRRYLSYLRNRWWVVVVCLALTIGGTVAYETVRQETYSSYAQLYVTLPPQLGVSIFSESKDDFANQIELLKGPRLHRDALQSLGAESINQLKGPINVDVVRPMATSFLQLQVTSPDANLSQRFLTALIASYLEFKKDTRASTTKELTDSLKLELAKGETDLLQAKTNWAEFQKSHDVTLAREEARIESAYLARLKTDLEETEFNRGLRVAGLEPLAVPASTNFVLSVSETNPVAGATNLEPRVANPAAGTTNSQPTPSLNSDLALKNARIQLEMAKTNRQWMLTTETGPGLLEIEKYHGHDEVAQLERNVAVLEKAAEAEQQENLHDLDKRITAITGRIPQVESNLQTVNDLLSHAQLLNDDIQHQQVYYDSLVRMINGVDFSKNMAQEGISTYEEASPGMPAQRSLPLRIFLAVVAGLFLALGLVFVWHLFDDRLVSIHDLKDQFGETVLGLVPNVRVPKSKPLAALLEPGDPRAGYVESYRHLRSALLLSSLGEGRPQTLLLTGAIPAEGKTTIAVNLARMLAQGGQRVALVDADLRGGRIHQMIGREAGPGLLDFLRGQANAGDIIYPTETPGLVFVPSGSASGETDGLLNRPDVGELMKQLRQERDFVILDSAPILAADDASLLVPYSDAVIMVMCPFCTRAGQARRALEMLYQRQTRQVALILNRARTDDLATQYYAGKGASHAGRNGKA